MIISKFAGIRNTENARSIPNNALANCLDLDITDDGRLLQRSGYIQSKAIANLSTGYSLSNQEASYLVISGSLYQVLSDLSLIYLCSCSATAFCDEGNTLFTNDGLKITGNKITLLKFTFPQFAPVLTAISGSLPAGLYNATYTYLSATGLESGSAPFSTIELSSTGGIIIDPGIIPDGYTARLYLTEAGGTVYKDSSGLRLDPVQKLANPMPDADQIAFCDSSLYVSRQINDKYSALWWSKPFHYHLYDVDTNYLIITGVILMLAGTPQGLVIGTDKAIYAYDDGTLNSLADYGVVKGRAFSRLADKSILIWSQRGVCKYPGFANLTQSKASFPPGSQCSTAIMDKDGISRFICLNNGLGKAYNART